MIDRENLFLSAFSKEPNPKNPTPHKGQNWRFNTAKLGKLSFVEQYNLQEFEGVPYRDLPGWILDNGYAIPSQDEKAHQKEMLSSTGLTQSERNVVFNAALADVEALAAMTSSELLKNSAVLDNEIATLKAKYGSELDSMLQQVDPQAASYIQGRVKLKAAEAKVTREQQEKANSSADIAAEIAAAKEAIEAQNATSAENLSDEILRNELIRRASIAAHKAAESGE